MNKTPLDLAAIRARLAAQRGRQYWRSLEELANTSGFQEFLQREFPSGASEMRDPISRRAFLKLMGASMALAGLTGCTQSPPEKILPYVEAPEQLVPGKPLFFATAMTLGGYARGVLAESHMGRPTKIEGNTLHPASLGATDVFMQASILALYDPGRSQTVLNRGQISTWDAFLGALTTRMEAKRLGQGAGLRILTETVTSPTLASQIQTLLAEYPNARWHLYDPIGRDNVQLGARLAFAQNVNTIYRFQEANIVLSLNGDFLMRDPASVRYAREFADRRRVRLGESEMNRLYVVESTLTNTGAMADHRLALRASQIAAVARLIAQELGVAGISADRAVLENLPAEWITGLVNDLQANQGASIIIAGAEQPPVVHALAHAMNAALGNVGSTVIYTPPVEANPVNQTESLAELVADMADGQVDTLIILGGNPVYSAPADLDFAAQFANVDFRVHLSQYVDETSFLCQWHIPQTHYLETWSDARSFDGTATIMQPLIDPLYGGRSDHEVLAALLLQPNQTAYDSVRAYWENLYLGDDFERFWRIALHNGVVPGTELPTTEVALVSDFAAQLPPTPAAQTETDQGLELVFRPDPSIWDGSFANNAWLQELPRPVSKITWGNTAMISPTTAERLGLAVEDLVELHYQGRSVRAPIWIQPGHADESVTVSLGYGRTRVGSVGDGVGFNAYALRTSDAPWFGNGLEIRPTGEQFPIATTQNHFTMEGRELVRAASIQMFRENPYFVEEPEQPPPSLYPEFAYEGYAWGMAIDINTCIGCNACVVACQAENNIPVVGKEGVIEGREMHWLKIDEYFTFDTDLDHPQTFFQPRPCMHCEKAPCEVVCPVAATVHSSEGLNDMVYNRCVGTRYCSNNCPYKVRRFNFFQYAERDVPVIELMHNPDVTVRARGVMEKCTYCVQRINSARIEAQKENRLIRDGEVLTACQEACPTQAIVFGNINDLDTQVVQLKQQPHNYGLLAELGTRPRTTYLAHFTNPNPEIEPIPATEGE